MFAVFDFNITLISKIIRIELTQSDYNIVQLLTCTQVTDNKRRWISISTHLSFINMFPKTLL